ncbi:MAG TPA: CBS domain-containing protein [Vulgatibacter sp.]|nr:CBS domain-containing protein [Vulgatibacter sp.]
MSLKWYRRPRLVALHPDSTALEAARALENNAIGAVLVLDQGRLAGLVTDRDLATRVTGRGLDPKETRLDRIMTRGVATLEPSASQQDAIELMCRLKVRRIPLVEEGNLVGMVTFDDLLLDEAAPLDELSAVVEAQLGGGGPAPSPRTPAAQRRKARAEATLGRLLTQVQEATGLSREQSRTATELVLSDLVSRLTKEQADHFIAQLPSLMQEKLYALPPGPDTSIDRGTIEAQLVQRLDVDPDRAAQILEAIGAEALGSISPGEAEKVQAELPQDLREALLPAPPA